MRKRSILLAEEALTKTIARGYVEGARQLRCATKTGAWLMVQPSMVNGTELGAQEWRYVLFLRYGLDPPDLSHYCDNCNAKFSICQALNCKRGGLITVRHNEIHDRVADLDGKAFTPLSCARQPLIFSCCTVKRPKANTARNKGITVLDDAPTLKSTEQKVHLLMSDF